VGEVIHPKGKRAQSHFHRGYLDALSGTPLREPDGGEAEERRWYLCGYLETKADAEKPGLLKSLSGNDREALMEGNSEASAILFPQLIAPLLEAGDLTNAQRWIKSRTRLGDLHFATVVHDWAHPAMLNANKEDFGEIESLLEVVLSKLTSATGSESANGEVPTLIRRIERIYAICLRMEGKFGKSQARLDGLLANGGDDADRQDLLAQRALCKIGIRHYQDDMVFPLQSDHQKICPLPWTIWKQPPRAKTLRRWRWCCWPFPLFPQRPKRRIPSPLSGCSAPSTPCSKAGRQRAARRFGSAAGCWIARVFTWPFWNCAPAKRAKRPGAPFRN